MDIHLDYKEFVAALNQHKVKFLIVGAYAVGFHGFPRFTKDCDFWVDPSGKNAAKFLCALKNFFGTDFGLTVGDFEPGAIFQFGVAPVRIDAITSLPRLTFKTAWSNRVRSWYGSERASYLSLDDLIKAKRAAGRWQDLLDLKKLLLIKAKTRKKKR